MDIVLVFISAVVLSAPAANAEAPGNTTLIFKTGSTNYYTGALTIDRPMTLKGRDVVIPPN